MYEWYVMDIFNQVLGPYDVEETKRRVLKGSAVSVAKQGMKGWLAPEDAPELGLAAKPAPEQVYAPEMGRSAEDVLMIQRSLINLLNLCRNILKDGTVHPDEAAYLKAWVEEHPDAAAGWPADVLYKRLVRIFRDGKVDADEQEELTVLLRNITGEKPPVPKEKKAATRLYFDDPAPEIDFWGQTFCLLGGFAHGTRDYCEMEVVSKGGKCESDPSDEVDFLVLGALLPDKGAKDSREEIIERVLAARGNGARPAIVSEEHWRQFLK